MATDVVGLRAKAADPENSARNKDRPSNRLRIASPHEGIKKDYPFARHAVPNFGLACPWLFLRRFAAESGGIRSALSGTSPPPPGSGLSFGDRASIHGDRG